jgi:hypothetical protein
MGFSGNLLMKFWRLSLPFLQKGTREPNYVRRAETRVLPGPVFEIDQFDHRTAEENDENTAWTLQEGGWPLYLLGIVELFSISIPAEAMLAACETLRM